MKKNTLFQAPPVTNPLHKQALKTQLINAHFPNRVSWKERWYHHRWMLAPITAVCICLMMIGWHVRQTNQHPLFQYEKIGSIVWEKSGKELIIEGFKLENGAQILTIENKQDYSPDLMKKRIHPVQQIY